VFPLKLRGKLRISTANYASLQMAPDRVQLYRSYGLPLRASAETLLEVAHNP
jgi:hypothetical protein